MGVAKSHGGFAKEDGEIFMHAVADESCVIDGEEMGPAVQRIHVKASPSTRPKKPEPGGEVKMRIYDMSWASAVSPLNAVHVGVEVYNAEFSYGYAGLRCFTPGSYAAYKIRDTIALGRTNMTASQVTTMLQRLRREWLAEDIVPRSLPSALGWATCDIRTTASLGGIAKPSLSPSALTWASRPKNCQRNTCVSQALCSCPARPA